MLFLVFFLVEEHIEDVLAILMSKMSIIYHGHLGAILAYNVVLYEIHLPIVVLDLLGNGFFHLV